MRARAPCAPRSRASSPPSATPSPASRTRSASMPRRPLALSSSRRWRRAPTRSSPRRPSPWATSCTRPCPSSPRSTPPTSRPIPRPRAASRRSRAAPPASSSWARPAPRAAPRPRAPTSRSGASSSPTPTSCSPSGTGSPPAVRVARPTSSPRRSRVGSPSSSCRRTRRSRRPCGSASKRGPPATAASPPSPRSSVGCWCRSPPTRPHGRELDPEDREVLVQQQRDYRVFLAEPDPRRITALRCVRAPLVLAWRAFVRLLTGAPTLRPSAAAPLEEGPADPVAAHAERADGLARQYLHFYRGAFLVNFVLGATAVTMALWGLLAHEESSHGPARSVAPVVEIAALALIVVVFWRARAGRWHRKGVNYRVLAELFRQQRHLAPLGLTVPSIRPRAHVGGEADLSLAWMVAHARAVEREQGLRSGRFTPEAVRDAGERLRRGWLDEQAAYHDRLAHALERGRAPPRDGGAPALPRGGGRLRPPLRPRGALAPLARRPRRGPARLGRRAARHPRPLGVAAARRAVREHVAPPARARRASRVRSPWRRAPGATWPTRRSRRRRRCSTSSTTGRCSRGPATSRRREASPARQPRGSPRPVRGRVSPVSQGLPGDHRPSPSTDPRLRRRPPHPGLQAEVRPRDGDVPSDATRASKEPGRLLGAPLGQHWTRQRLIETLRKRARAGKPLALREPRGPVQPGASTPLRHLGEGDATGRARSQQPPPFGDWDEDLVVAAIAERHAAGLSLSMSSVAVGGRLPVRSVDPMFRSWGRALAAAGFDPKVHRVPKKWNLDHARDWVLAAAKKGQSLLVRDVPTGLYGSVQRRCRAVGRRSSSRWGSSTRGHAIAATGPPRPCSRRSGGGGGAGSRSIVGAVARKRAGGGPPSSKLLRLLGRRPCARPAWIPCP